MDGFGYLGWEDHLYLGEILNSKPNGKGKKINREGQITFEGIFKEGKEFRGKGKIRWMNDVNNRESIYSGSIYDSLPSDQGTLFDLSENETIWSGKWNQGKKYTGKGLSRVYENWIFSGEIVKQSFIFLQLINQIF